MRGGKLARIGNRSAGWRGLAAVDSLEAVQDKPRRARALGYARPAVLRGFQIDDEEMGFRHFTTGKHLQVMPCLMEESAPGYGMAIVSACNGDVCRYPASRMRLAV